MDITNKSNEAFFAPQEATATLLRKARLFNQQYAGVRKISSFIPFTEFTLLAVKITQDGMRRVMCKSEDVQWFQTLNSYGVPAAAFIYEFTNDQWLHFSFYTTH